MNKNIIILVYNKTSDINEIYCLKKRLEPRLLDIFQGFEVIHSYMDLKAEEDEKLNNLGFIAFSKAIKCCEGKGSKVYIQPLILAGGEIFRNIQSYLDMMKAEDIRLGEALLETGNIENFKIFLMKLINESYSKRQEKKYTEDFRNSAYIFIVHGSSRRGNISYERLKKAIKEEFPYSFLISIRDKEAIEALVEELKEKNYKNLTMIPLFIYNGYHMKEDILSEKTSLIQREFIKQGINYDILNGALADEGYFIDLIIKCIEKMML